jgi:tetratricopeptide (TPR) repeat protein
MAYNPLFPPYEFADDFGFPSGRRDSQNPHTGTMKSGKQEQLLHEAVARHQAGDLRHAIDSYQRYLRTEPGNAGVLHALGGLYYQIHDLKNAGAMLEKAHQSAPDNPDYLNDLGAFCLMQGQYSDAARYLAQLVRLTPGNPRAHYNHGLALHGAGRPADAVKAFDTAITLQPDYAEALYNLGATLQQLGQFERALESCRRAVRAAPNLLQAHFKLGKILAQQDRYDEAVTTFLSALDLAPDNAQIIIQLTEVMPPAGRTEEGITLVEKALQRHPVSVALMNCYGKLLHIAGRLEEAEACFNKAISLDKADSSLCLNYSRIRKFCREDSAIIARMETLLGDKRLAEAGRVDIHYALGKIYDDCDDYDQAFAHYREANTLQGRNYHYDREANERWTTDTIACFDRGYFTAHAHLGTTVQRPIFIVGMPRSGTTLIEQILASHPQVAGAGELVYFSCIAANLPYLLGNNAPYPQYYQALDAPLCEKITAHYLALLDRHTPTARLVVDKMPSNFMHLGLIRVLFPEAPVIHCRRDPLDVCLSIYFQFFLPAHDYATDLLNIGHKYLQYARLMAHWRRVLPGPYLEIRYEDLVANQEARSRELIDFCGLEWDPACLDFHESRRDVRTASNWQVRQPLYTGSVRRWQHYEKYLDPLRKLFEDAQAKL